MSTVRVTRRRRLLALAALSALLAAALAGRAAATPEPPTVKPDRAGVNALLDRFIPDVVAAKDLPAGWALVLPGVRGAKSDWLKGDTPFQRYPAKGTAFHGWNTTYSYPGDVGFDILVQPVKPTDSPWAFHGEAKKVGGSWKIALWYPVATFAPAGKTQTVLGPNDLQPGIAAGDTSSRISSHWLLAPFALLGALLAGGIAFAALRHMRHRSRIRAVERSLGR